MSTPLCIDGEQEKRFECSSKKNLDYSVAKFIFAPICEWEENGASASVIGGGDVLCFGSGAYSSAEHMHEADHAGAEQQETGGLGNH
jgi:hypothetical protein